MLLEIQKYLFDIQTSIDSIESDIDLIVEISEKDPFLYSDNYFNLKTQLEDLFHRNIDLLEQKTIKNLYLMQQIDLTKVLVYEDFDAVNFMRQQRDKMSEKLSKMSKQEILEYFNKKKLSSTIKPCA